MGTVRRAADPMRFVLPIHLVPYTNTLTVTSRGGKRLHGTSVGRQNVMAGVVECRMPAHKKLGAALAKLDKDFRRQPFRLIGFQVDAASHHGMLDT